MGVRHKRGVRDHLGIRFPWIPIIGVLVGVAEAFAIKFLFHIDEPIYGYIAALITVVISLQIDQIIRTQEAVERARGNGGFEAKLDRDPWVRELIEEIVDSTAAINAMPDNEIFVRRAKAELEKCLADTRELAVGRIRANPARYCQVVLPMVSKVEKTIRGVAISNPRNAFKWWDTPQGKEYWARNLAALGRGARIERIFAYQADENGEMPEGLRKLASEQAAAGVSVYTVETAELPYNLQVDLAIFDEDAFYELRLSTAGDPLEYFCSTHPPTSASALNSTTRSSRMLHRWRYL
jgi:hypothetical protein